MSHNLLAMTLTTESETVHPSAESEVKKTKPKVPKRERLINEVELALHIKTVRLLCLGYTDPDKIGLLRLHS